MTFSPLWISLRIAAIATLLAFVLGIAAAQFMQGYRGRWRSLLDSLFLAPMVLPPYSAGLFTAAAAGSVWPPWGLDGDSRHQRCVYLVCGSDHRDGGGVSADVQNRVG